MTGGQASSHWRKIDSHSPNRNPRLRPGKAKLSVDANLTQQFEIAEHLAGTEHDRSQRIVGDRNGQTGLLADALVQILEQRAAPGKDDAAVADVGGKFGRGALESDPHGVDDGGDALG